MVEKFGLTFISIPYNQKNLGPNYYKYRIYNRMLGVRMFKLKKQKSVLEWGFIRRFLENASA